MLLYNTETDANTDTANRCDSGAIVPIKSTSHLTRFRDELLRFKELIGNHMATLLSVSIKTKEDEGAQVINIDDVESIINSIITEVRHILEQSSSYFNLLQK